MRGKCDLAILPYSGIIPRDSPAEHVLKHITVSSLVKLEDDFSYATVYVGSFLAIRHLFCYWFKNEYFVRNDRNATECCA